MEFKKPNLLLNDPSKIDLRKIYFDNVLQKWELVEMSFAKHYRSIFFVDLFCLDR